MTVLDRAGSFGALSPEAAPARHKSLLDWRRQMLWQLRRWLPERPLVLVALLAAALHERGQLRLRSAAWYDKPQLTFADTIAAVRQYLWTNSLFAESSSRQDQIKMSRALFQHLTEALCSAA